MGKQWILIVLLVTFAGCKGKSSELLVFSAAGMTDAVSEIAQGYDGCEVVVSFASSSTLARQIEKGAPADVYISANETWMDYLQDKDLIVETSRRNLVGNRLALIAPAGNAVDLEVGEGMDLVGALGDGKLATGDPDHVPVGMYAREALENLGQWEGVEKHVARLQSTRAALVLVERGEAALGIVYATDAMASERVRLVGLFDESAHRPIVFSAAIVTGHESKKIRHFFDHLTGEGVSPVFVKHGYELVK